MKIGWSRHDGLIEALSFIGGQRLGLGKVKVKNGTYFDFSDIVKSHHDFKEEFH